MILAEPPPPALTTETLEIIGTIVGGLDGATGEADGVVVGSGTVGAAVVGVKDGLRVVGRLVGPGDGGFVGTGVGGFVG